MFQVNFLSSPCRFYSTDTKEMYDMILHADLFIPEFVTPHATDLLIQLLARDPSHRYCLIKR